MIKYTLNLLFISLIIPTLVIGQEIDFQNYSGLYSEGMIPDDFTKLSSAKYEEEKSKIDKTAQRKDRKSQDEFYLESSFLMDNLLHSGRVVFGDPVTIYLNKIKDEILKNEPELKSQIRIYTYKNPVANAFTANNGIVLFTTGLLAQCENEAQIAFILCHEFNHYIKSHAVNSYVEGKKMERGNGVYKNLSRRDLQNEQMRYSKDLEMEADKLGVELFLNTKYSLEAVSSSFDVLLYSYLPFDDIEFPKTFFNQNTFIIPVDYFLDSIQAVSAEEDYDDKQSTHPNIKKRKEEALENLGVAANDGKKEFLVSEEQFEYVRKICRYENVRLELNELEYEPAFYDAFLLLQDDSTSLLLKKYMGKALYGISKYKTERSYGLGMHISYKKVEGSSQQVYYMAEKIPSKDFSILALKYCYPVYESDTSDSEMKEIYHDLVSEITTKHNMKLSDFKSEYSKNLNFSEDTIQVQNADTTILKTDKETKKSSKYQKLKQQEEEQALKETKSGDNAYWKYAFVEFMNNKNFTSTFTSIEEKITGERGVSENEDENIKTDYNADYKLGIDKLVVVDPYYMRVDERSNEQVKFVASEEAKIDLKNKIETSASLLDMNVEILESTNITSADVDKFNEMAVLNDWISEKLSHQEKNIEILNSSQKEFEQISNKYDTDNFAWMGIISFTEKERNVALRIISCIFVYAAPFIIYDLLEPNNSSFFFTIVADGNTGKLKMEYYNVSDLKDRDSVQKSNLYYILQQMKTKPNK